MVDFLNAQWTQKSYTLSQETDKPLVIPKEVIKLCGKQDIFVLDFLYRSYKKKLNGVILNLDQDINPHLQVSIFHSALHISLKNTPFILVLCPEDAIIKWHYYMTTCGLFNIKIITSEDNFEDIAEGTVTVFLLGFLNIKLVENLLHYDFFSVVIDNYDEIATKIILRKLQSSFNIGITYRNFYSKPDPKLKWTMLNWTNRGCVGKLIDFYEVDNENIASFRDNYKEWWFRLTWNFCESFVRPTLDEKGTLSKILREWANEHGLSRYMLQQGMKKSSRIKRKVPDEIHSEKADSEEENVPKKTKAVYNKTTRKKFNKINYNVNNNSKNTIITPKSKSEDSDSAESSGTIIYEDLPQVYEQVEPVIDSKKEENETVENTSCNFNDTASMSSEEGLFFSLVHDEKSFSQLKSERIVKEDSQTNKIESKDDESDLFFKSVATNNEIIYTNRSLRSEAFFNKFFDEDKTEDKCSSSLNLELAEQRLLGSDLPTESDQFVKSICGARRICGNSLENKNCPSTSTLSDVDALLAKAMKIARK